MTPLPSRLPALSLLLPLAACTGTTSTPRSNPATDADGDGYYASDDCDDADPTVHPDATEVCDGIDNDCDALVDDDDDSLDASTAGVYHPDDDGDGYGEQTTAVTACIQPTGTVTDGTDCDDGDAGVHPDATEVCDPDDVDEDCSGAADDADSRVDAATTSTWYTDADGDGFGDAATAITACDPASDQVADDSDCDDADAAVHPDATEVCDPDDVDEDCSGDADDADSGVDAASRTTWYADTDGDGFGDPTTAVDACEAPSGAVEDGTDCDDGDDAIHPDATEVCDADDVDEDCSGAADDADPGVDATTQVATRPDTDGDGFGDATAADTLYCDPPSGVVEDSTDCDDGDDAIHPDATEVCDASNVDEDCSGAADDDDPGVDASTQTPARPDGDGDGFGDATAADTLYCDLPSGMVADSTDCDDGDGAINPDATEVCDADDVDEDCSGAADDADPGVDASTRTDWYPDLDGDGYGDASASPSPACDSTAGLADNTDCDDTDASVNPGATELCDTVDNDCDASTSHAGMVTFTDASGTPTDVTSTFAAGTAAAPVAVSAAAAGDYAFCEGTFYTHIDATADATFRGADGAVVLDGGDSDTVLTVSGAGVSVELMDLSIESGLATALASVGYYTGGGVACMGADSVTLSGVAVRDNAGESGAGIAAEDCDVYLDDSVVEDNVPAGGLGFGSGILAYGASALILEDSLITGNEAPWAGGLLVVGPGPVELNGTLIDGNIAEQAPAADFMDYTGLSSAISCTGSASAPAGIINNSYDPIYGGWGAAVQIGDTTGTLTFTSSGCDFGTPDGGDDNEGGALQHGAGAGWLLRHGDDLSFSCTESGCGPQTTHALANTGSLSQYSADDQLRGNVFLATAEGTIDSAALYLRGASSCVADHYILSSATLSGTGWRVEHEETGSGTYTYWRDTGSSFDWGIVTEPGRYYALLTGWKCSTAGENVEFELQAASAAPTDLAIGTHQGTVSMGGYSGSLGSTGVSLSVTATTEQYSGTIVVTAL